MQTNFGNFPRTKLRKILYNNTLLTRQSRYNRVPATLRHIGQNLQRYGDKAGKRYGDKAGKHVILKREEGAEWTIDAESTCSLAIKRTLGAYAVPILQ